MNAEAEIALVPIYAQYEYLVVLVRRGRHGATECLSKFWKFDDEIKKRSDKLNKRFKVDCIYGIPERKYKQYCEWGRLKLLRTLGEINNTIYLLGVAEVDKSHLRLASKLCAYHAYGFLTEGEMIGLN